MAPVAKTSPAMRALHIKSSAVQRMMKEVEYYRKEQAEQEAKISKMHDDGADEHDIKQQKQVLSETLSVQPESMGKLEHFLGELRSLLASEEVPVATDDEECPAAKALAQAQEVLQKADSCVAEGGK